MQTIPENFNPLLHRTCGDHCWHAREEICRCSCGGVNHGILKDPNNKIPQRTRRIGTTFYVLEAVVEGSRTADEYIKEWYAEHDLRQPFSHSLKPNWGPSPLMGYAYPSKSQMEKWVEVAPFKNWRSKGNCLAEARQYEPVLIWKQQNPDIESSRKDPMQKLHGVI